MDSIVRLLISTFSSRFCHEYGHLLRNCPKVRKDADSPSLAPSPLGKEDKGKAPMMAEPQGKDKDLYLLKLRLKDVVKRGHSRIDRQMEVLTGLRCWRI